VRDVFFGEREEEEREPSERALRRALPRGPEEGDAVASQLREEPGLLRVGVPEQHGHAVERDAVRGRPDHLAHDLASLVALVVRENGRGLCERRRVERFSGNFEQLLEERLPHLRKDLGRVRGGPRYERHQIARRSQGGRSASGGP
jgi:hypothetical protein